MLAKGRWHGSLPLIGKLRLSALRHDYSRMAHSEATRRATAGEQKGDQSAVAFPLDARTGRRLLKRLSLLRREPVAEANSNFLHTLDSADTHYQVRSENAAVSHGQRLPGRGFLSMGRVHGQSQDD